jgi:hypothetical protein
MRSDLKVEQLLIGALGFLGSVIASEIIGRYYPAFRVAVLLFAAISMVLLIYWTWKHKNDQRAKVCRIQQENVRLREQVENLAKANVLDPPPPGILLRTTQGFLKCLEGSELIGSSTAAPCAERQYRIVDYRRGADGELCLTAFVKSLQAFQSSGLNLFSFEILDEQGAEIGIARPVGRLDDGTIEMGVQFLDGRQSERVRDSCGRPGERSESFAHSIRLTSPSDEYKISDANRRRLLPLARSFVETLREALSDGR